MILPPQLSFLFQLNICELYVFNIKYINGFLIFTEVYGPKCKTDDENKYDVN